MVSSSFELLHRASAHGHTNAFFSSEFGAQDSHARQPVHRECLSCQFVRQAHRQTQLSMPGSKIAFLFSQRTLPQSHVSQPSQRSLPAHISRALYLSIGAATPLKPVSASSPRVGHDVTSSEIHLSSRFCACPPVQDAKRHPRHSGHHPVTHPYPQITPTHSSTPPIHALFFTDVFREDMSNRVLYFRASLRRPSLTRRQRSWPRC